MAYTKQTWINLPNKTTPINAERLNHIEDGIYNKQDKLTAGSNIQINGTTISATDTKYSAATQSSAGLMSAADKTKIDSVNAPVITGTQIEF